MTSLNIQQMADDLKTITGREFIPAMAETSDGIKLPVLHNFL